MSLCWILIDGFSLFLIIWLSSFSVLVPTQTVPCSAATLYLHKLLRVRLPVQGQRSPVFAFLFFCCFFMSCICARTCFMVNKRAPKSLSRWSDRRSQRWDGTLEDGSWHIGQLFSIWGPPTHIHIRFKTWDVYCPWQHFSPLWEWANNNPSVWDKPGWVFSETRRFIARWRIQYLQLIQVWLRGGFWRSLPSRTPLAALFFPSPTNENNGYECFLLHFDCHINCFYCCHYALTSHC